MKTIKKYLWLLIPIGIGLFILSLKAIDQSFRTKERLTRSLGQFFIVGFKDLDSLTDTIRRFAPGGIIFYSHNIPSEFSLKDTIKSIGIEYESLHLRPPFLAIDHEGGGVFRLFNTKALQPPSAESIGLSNDRAFAEKVALTSACELKELGFNMVMAPVFDYWKEPCSPIRRRSFSSQQSTAEEFANITASQYSKLGIHPVFKHFPNLGDTLIDTHTSPFTASGETLPRLSKMATISPFLLISHAIYPSIDSSLPVSIAMSRNDFLKIGGEGVIRITDDLSMLRNQVGISLAVTKSWSSDVDMLLMGANYYELPLAIEQLYTEVTSQKYQDLNEYLRNRGRRLLEIRTSLVNQSAEVSSCSRKFSRGDYLAFSRKMLRSIGDISTIKSTIRNRQPDVALMVSKLTANLAKKHIKNVVYAPNNLGTYDLLLTLPKGSIAIAEITESYLKEWNTTLKVLDPSITVIGLVPDSASLPVTIPTKGTLVFSSSLTNQAREALVEGLFDEKPIESFSAQNARCK